MESVQRPPPRVAIVGAGVIGLSVAVRLSESSLPLHLTVIADKFSPDTTGDRAGGSIIPFPVGVSEQALMDIKRWSIPTFSHFKALYESGVRDEIGLSVRDCFLPMSLPATGLPWLKEVVFDLEVVDPKEVLAARSLNARSGDGELKSDESKPTEIDNPDEVWHSYLDHARKAGFKVCKCKVFIVEAKCYLPWLMKRFLDKNGVIEKKRIDNLSELSQSFDLVINCTGLQARELTGDTLLHPIRGQTVTVKNSKVKEFIVFETREDGIFPYAIPHRDDVIILGGTVQEDDWSTSPDPETAHMIYEAGMECCPSLKGSEVTGGWACLRPARESVRLELEESCDSHVIHCYGHGGQGFVLHWGCALDVEEIVRKFFKHVTE